MLKQQVFIFAYKMNFDESKGQTEVFKRKPGRKAKYTNDTERYQMKLQQNKEYVERRRQKLKDFKNNMSEPQLKIIKDLNNCVLDKEFATKLYAAFLQNQVDKIALDKEI
jgi:hypothetical protein